jgi:hypothetical protein
MKPFFLGASFCRKVCSIRIDLDVFEVDPADDVVTPYQTVTVTAAIRIHTDRKDLEGEELTRFIWADGFRNANGSADILAFLDFFRGNHGLAPGNPFHGGVIHWITPIRPEHPSRKPA